MPRLFGLFALAISLLLSGPARADDRATIAEALTRVATAADAFARSADASADRNVRRKVATKARELSEDLTSLARRARKDAPLVAIQKDALTTSRDSTRLIDLADEADNKEERKSLRAQATVIDQQLAVVRRQIDDAVTAEAKAQAQPAKPAPMVAPSFAALVASVKKETMDAGRLSVVNRALPTNWFTSAQVGTMMDAFTGKVEVAVAMWPRIVDPENSFTIYDHCPYTAEKEAIRRRVSK